MSEEAPDRDRIRQRPLSRRLLWFAGLWLAGVAVVGGAAYLIRLANPF